jgi:hypothetical protein
MDNEHLITWLPDPGTGITSSTRFHNEPWLAANMHQTHRDVQFMYGLMYQDYRLTPAKPAINTEAAHEDGSEYGFNVNATWMRRQAYYCYLPGGFYSYGHTLGHSDNVALWQEKWNSGGAMGMKEVSDLFLSLPWWNLVPDQSLLTQGGVTDGRELTLAARCKDGNWALAYLCNGGSVTVDMSKLSGPAKAWWYDPRTGELQVIGEFDNSGTQQFSAPAGGPDWTLVLHDKSIGLPEPGTARYEVAPDTKIGNQYFRHGSLNSSRYRAPTAKVYRLDGSVIACTQSSFQGVRIELAPGEINRQTSIRAMAKIRR